MKKIRSRTKLIDIIDEIANMKWRWTKHIARLTKNRWTYNIMEWTPGHTKSMGRPEKRWVDDIR